jgi:nicotinate-nucleotide adenylyltransferase
MRIGIFGGTFDPPHVGHLILAAEALEQLDLQRILWVLTLDPPHKQGRQLSPLDLRLEMVEAAIADNSAFELSRIEIDRPGPHFAYETVQLLSDQFSKAELYYLIGGDSLRDLLTWRNPEELIKSVAGLGVMRRPGARINLNRLEREIPGLTQKIIFIDTPRLEISSRLIRQRAAQGRTFRYYLPEKVFRIVDRNQLYG